MKCFVVGSPVGSGRDCDEYQGCGVGGKMSGLSKISDSLTQRE